MVNQIIGAVELGLVYGLMVLGVFVGVMNSIA